MVAQLWAPSVLMPDWNQTQVSRISESGKVRAISWTMASVPIRATSYSVMPAVMALRMASPPRSPMRAPCLMTAISSADLIMRWRMAAWATSTRVAPSKAAWILLRLSSGRVSSSTPSRRTVMPRVRRASWMAKM